MDSATKEAMKTLDEKDKNDKDEEIKVLEMKI